jgi:transposase
MTVMIGIDPHKRSHTAVALDEHDAVLDELRLDADVRQIARLLGGPPVAASGSGPSRTPTGSGGCSPASCSRPASRSVTCPRRCRPRSASCRARGTRPTPTTPARPRSRAVTPAVLRTVVPTAPAGARADRAALADRLGPTEDAGAHPRTAHQTRPWRRCTQLSADKTAVCCARSARPTRSGRCAGRSWSSCSPSCAVWTASARRSTPSSTRALDDYGTCLTDIDGIGRVAAATIISIVGDVRRFPTADHFASFTGTAPVAASSGEVVRYRLNLGGQRQMNKVLHTAAKVQISHAQQRRPDLHHRKLAEGKTRAEAIRSLKRHLSNVVYRALQADARRA